MRSVPLLSDLQTTKTRYNAGDRIVAKVRTNLTADQRAKLYRNLVKFCEADVNLLVVNLAVMGLRRIRIGDVPLRIADLITSTDESKMGVANVDLAKVDFLPGDQLYVTMRVKMDRLQRGEIMRAIQRWCGDGVEVLIDQYKNPI